MVFYSLSERQTIHQATFVMRDFHVDLDSTGQTIVHHSRRQLFLVASILVFLIALVMIVSSFLQEGWLMVFFSINSGIYLFVAAVCFQLYHGKNVLSLSLGNFFSLTDRCIRYRFSAFTKPKEICWEKVRFAEIRLFTVFLWIGDSITEINLEEIRHLPTRQLIKQRLRTQINEQCIGSLPQLSSSSLPFVV